MGWIACNYLDPVSFSQIPRIRTIKLTYNRAFIIAEVIPFFSDLLGLMSSLFDSFFGFIFWGVAFIRMRRVDGTLYDKTFKGISLLALNIVIILIGLYFLTAGTYTTVQSIIDSYNSGLVGGVFTCADNGVNWTKMYIYTHDMYECVVRSDKKEHVSI